MKVHTETLSSLSSGDDFLDIAENYFKSISSLINQEAEKLAFEGRDCQRNGRVLWGLIGKGNYGYGAVLKDVRTKEIKYERDPGDAELLPYFYLLYVPTGCDKMMLILQKYGNQGIKGVLANAITARFNADKEDDLLKLDFKACLDAEVMYEYFKRGEVKKIRFVMKTLPPDIADKVEDNPERSSDGEAELSIVKLRDRELRKIFGPMYDDLKAGRRPSGVMLDVKPDIGIPYDFVKIEVEKPAGQNKKRKVFDFIKDDGFIESREINEGDKGVVFTDGLPTYESVFNKALEYLGELCENGHVARPNPVPVFPRGVSN